ETDQRLDRRYVHGCAVDEFDHAVGGQLRIGQPRREEQIELLERIAGIDVGEHERTLFDDHPTDVFWVGDEVVRHGNTRLHAQLFHGRYESAQIVRREVHRYIDVHRHALHAVDHDRNPACYHKADPCLGQ